MPGWEWLYQNKIPTNRRMTISYQKGKTLTTVVEMIDLKGINLEFENSDHQPVKLSIVLN